MKMEEKYLPIGTVCMLKNGKKRVMINGFCTVADENKQMYDYSGCFYPEGVISQKTTILFNHDQIDKIYFMGYSDEEDKEFKKNLNKIMEKVNSGELKIEDLFK